MPELSGLTRIRAAFAARVPAGRTLTDDTNFFEAGFTSLLLAQVLADLTGDGIRMDLVDLFRYPTVAALAEAVAARQAPAGRAATAGRLPWQAAR
jgi:aryl carrier-like protein